MKTGLPRLKELLQNKSYYFEYVVGMTKFPKEGDWYYSKIVVHTNQEYGTDRTAHITCHTGTFDFEEGGLQLYSKYLPHIVGVDTLYNLTADEVIEILELL